MNHAQLIAHMGEVAKPVIEAYWTDFTHDARLIADAPRGSTFLWAPYKHGTRVIVLGRGERPNIRAASIFSAMQDNAKTASDTPLAWHCLRVEGDDSAMALCTADEACAEAWNATRKAECDPRHISELNM